MKSNSTTTRKRITGFTICAWLVLASCAAAAAQASRSAEPQFKELPNFGRVNERLYRGGQPRKHGIEKLRTLGVNTIINLRGDGEGVITEEAEAKRAGLRYFNVQLKRTGRPSDAKVDQILSLIKDKENGVVFVHCHQGADRTGTIVALYRIIHDGWTEDEATREADRFGMNFWQVRMKRYISEYSQKRSRRAGQ